MPKLSLAIPVYHNEASLPVLYDRLCEVERRLQQRNVDLELIFIDDGSTDRSFEELLKIKQKRPATKLIKLTRNFGASRASKIGAQHASGDCFLIIAADLQDPPELIPDMVARWQAGQKFVICVRRTRDDPFFTRLFARLYYTLVRRMVCPQFPIDGYDMGLIDRSILTLLQQGGKTLHAPIFLFMLGFQPEVIYYDRAKRQHGRSRWTFGKRLVAAVDVLFGYSVMPIRMVSLIGFLVSLFSCTYALSVIIHALLGHREVMGFATLVALISFLLGLIIVTLGVIGEYLWRISEETNKRPEAVIQEIQ